MNKIKPHIALLLCNSIWAVNYPIYHIVSTHSSLTASTTLSLSLLTAALFSFIQLLWSKGERVDRSDIKYMFAAAVLSGILRKGLVIYGLSLTSPIEASIIASLLPVMALIISVAMGIDRFTMPRIFGIALGMGGALAVILSSGSTATNPHSALAGNGLMFIYTIAAGFYMVWLQPLFKKYKPITLMRWVYSLSSIMFLPFAAHGDLEIGHTLHSLSPHLLWMTLFVILIPTFLPNILLNYALGRVTPTISSIYSYLQPLLAIGVSVWLGVGKLHWNTLIFGALIISGVWLVVRSYAKKQ